MNRCCDPDEENSIQMKEEFSQHFRMQIAFSDYIFTSKFMENNQINSFSMQSTFTPTDYKLHAHIYVHISNIHLQTLYYEVIYLSFASDKHPDEYQQKCFNYIFHVGF